MFHWWQSQVKLLVLCRGQLLSIEGEKEGEREEEKREKGGTDGGQVKC